MSGKIEAKLAELGVKLPETSTPQANYIPYTVTGNLVFISGQVSGINGDVITGKLGADVELERGYEAARYCALNILAHLKNACDGDLDRVVRAVKLGGFVNATDSFSDPPKVINGASDLLVEILGDAGRHARFAVAVACLPLNAAVEIDAVFEIA